MGRQGEQEFGRWFPAGRRCWRSKRRPAQGPATLDAHRTTVLAKLAQMLSSRGHSQQQRAQVVRLDPLQAAWKSPHSLA